MKECESLEELIRSMPIYIGVPPRYHEHPSKIFDYNYFEAWKNGDTVTVLIRGRHRYFSEYSSEKVFLISYESNQTMPVSEIVSNFKQITNVIEVSKIMES